MALKTLEYWSAPASTAYEAAQLGQKPNLKGIPQSQRCFYMSAYRRAA